MSYKRDCKELTRCENSNILKTLENLWFIMPFFQSVTEANFKLFFSVVFAIDTLPMMKMKIHLE